MGPNCAEQLRQVNSVPARNWIREQHCIEVCGPDCSRSFFSVPRNDDVKTGHAKKSRPQNSQFVVLRNHQYTHAIWMVDFDIPLQQVLWKYGMYCIEQLTSVVAFCYWHSPCCRKSQPTNRPRAQLNLPTSARTGLGSSIQATIFK